jgi:cytochrome d ubiquinol oxidase subunit II
VLTGIKVCGHVQSAWLDSPVVGADVAAVFLAADSVRAHVPDLTTAFRRRALGSAILAGAMAIGGLLVIRDDARDLYDGLTSGGGLVMVVVSAAVGVLTLWLLWTNRFEIARYTSGIAVGAMLAGLAFAQRPDFLPGELSLRDGLFRLTLQGRLSEQFRPIVTPVDGADR